MIDRWTPFEAACLITGFVPGKFSQTDGHAIAYAHPLDSESCSTTAPLDREAKYTGTLPEHYEPEVDYGAFIRRTTIVLLRNNPDSDTLDPAEIVAWAVCKGYIHANSVLARALLSRNDAPHVTPAPPPTEAFGSGLAELTQLLRQAKAEREQLRQELAHARSAAKDTNKRHAELRERVHAAALHRLATEVTTLIASLSEEDKARLLSCPSLRVLKKSGQIVASRLAGLVNDNRLYYGFRTKTRIRRSRQSMIWLVMRSPVSAGKSSSISRHFPGGR